MTPTSQFAQHPDPMHPDLESLNAFVENALSAHERESVLAHLADCKRCREITYLAQAAAEDEPAITASAGQPALEAKPESREKLLRWPSGIAAGSRRLVILAGALAALAAFTIVSLPKHPAPPTNQPQEAKVTAAPAPNSVPPPPKTAEAPSTAQSANAVHSAAKAAIPAQSTAGRAVSPITPTAPMYSVHQSYGDVASRKAATPPAPPPSLTTDSTLATVSVTPEPQLQQVGSQQQIEVQQQAEARQQVNQEISATSDALQVQPAQQAGPTPAAEKPAPPRPAIMGGQGFGKVTTGAAAARKSPQPAPPAPYRAHGAAGAPLSANTAALYSRAPGVNDNVLADKALQTILPTGAHPVITVAAHERVLALDPSGAIYLSDNIGSLWLPVTQQWTGHATTLRVAPPTSADKKARASAGTLTGLSTNAPQPNNAAPAAIFELVNDQGVIWTSEDGKLWKERNQP